MVSLAKKILFLLLLIFLISPSIVCSAELPSKYNDISEEKSEHFNNRESYRTKTEGFALAFFGGNYGLGGGLTFVTLRWRYFFWEIFRLQITGASYFKNNRNGWSLNAKTMVGVPIFLDENNRHEIRLSTGFSAGFSAKKDRDDIEDYVFYNQSNVNIPFDVSYVFHLDKNVAFQIGAALDLPVFLFSGDDDFVIIHGFIGFRI
jgi:hypothetical protein